MVRGMSPLEALTTVLDEDHARGVIEFRQKTIKKPLSEFAAKLLAKELSKAPDPNAAAEEMVLRNWRGFKVEWLFPKQSQHLTNLDILEQDLAERIRNGAGGQGSLDFASVPSLPSR